MTPSIHQPMISSPPICGRCFSGRSKAAACERPTTSSHTGTSGWTALFSSEDTCTGWSSKNTDSRHAKIVTEGDCSACVSAVRQGLAYGPADSALGRCWALAGLGHPVACPAPGGLAELPSQLALGQRPARLYAGTVGGHRGGVDVAVPVGSSQQPWEPGTWSAWSAAFQPGPLAWPVPAIPDMGSGPSAPPGVRPVSCLIRFPGLGSGR